MLQPEKKSGCRRWFSWWMLHVAGSIMFHIWFSKVTWKWMSVMKSNTFSYRGFESTDWGDFQVWYHPWFSCIRISSEKMVCVDFWKHGRDGTFKWVMYHDSMTGWWFGTWILFFHILGIVIPADFHLFQRGRSTTNQMIMYPFYPCLTIYRWCSQRTKPPFSAGISHPLGIFFRCLWRRIMKDFGVAMG